MKYIIAIMSLLTIFFMAWAVSFNRQGIKDKLLPISYCLLIQIGITYVLTHTNIGIITINAASAVFDKLLSYAHVGTEFVFGGLTNQGGFSFLLEALMPIVFICAIIGILKHTKILPFFMRVIGSVLNKISRSGKLESYGAISAVVLGMTAVFVAIKESLHGIEKKRLYTLSAATISSVDLSIVAAYMKMIEPRYVILAILLNIFSFFIIVSIINPYKLSHEEDHIKIGNEEDGEEQGGFFAVLTEHIWDGFKIVAAIAAMVVAFVALIALLNGVFAGIFGITFQHALGYLFSPLAFLIGIPWAESIQVGSIMATKLVANEFVAMLDLTKVMTSFDQRTAGIISVFLISYANFGSIGIIVGAVNGLNSSQAKVVAGFSMRLLYGASLVSLLSATIAGIML